MLPGQWIGHEIRERCTFVVVVVVVGLSCRG